MSHRLSVLTIAIVLLVPGQSASAAPSNVTVRVEGAATTLLERTAVRTTTATVNKDGSAGHDCTGTSAAGALEIATGGNWNGTWFDPFGYGVERILGETHAFPEPDFFSLWINNRETSEGICGATSELQEGDEVLFFTARCEFDGNACANAPVLPLGLAVPRLVAPGAQFEAKVVRYSIAGTPSPVAGATVAGGDAAASTDATGRAILTIAAGGERTLKASLAGHARSAGEKVCASPAPTCGAGGTPAAPRDAIAPAATLLGIRDGQRFTRANAPRRLRARVATDPSGLLTVKLRLSRIDRGRCTYFSGKSERFRLNDRGRCGAPHGFWFSVGDRNDVDYLLPSKLPRGRYVLDVKATDKAFNREDARRRGSNRAVFRVG